MGFYDSEEGIKEYIMMSEGYDGKELIEVLRHYLPEGSSLLEIGMGPGKDLDMLRETYRATGSDTSQLFWDRYMKANEGADILLLDARTLETDRTFDCIFSNKVLQHITSEELAVSLDKQREVLNEGGILFHSFWKGDTIEEFSGLLFVNYTEERLRELFARTFEVVELESYEEMEPDDSIFVIARKR